ncbi:MULTISPECIES: YlmC/YmxH family sporulation protein [Sporosarcina]|uniref:PRC-barrel domain-containing protein n=1 Tax=Sporosarcina contaminans TaxID=633403 RepID=A0ABW3TU83_9BACL
MRFSEFQKKEVIEVKKGSFLGYVQDASVDIKNGKLESIHVGGAERSFFMDSKVKDMKQIKYHEVLTIGKDIVLVGKKSDN